MSVRRWGMIGVLTAVTLASPPALQAQGEIFERGNQLYQQEDYQGATDAYEAVLAAGFESAELYYNLGNALFKRGDLGRSILEWERALVRSPGDPDVLANLELARSLTADAVEPLPRFWLLSAASWWVDLISRGWLILIVGGSWLAAAGGTVGRILTRSGDVRRLVDGVILAGVVVTLVCGTNLAIRELGIGRPDRGVILADAVSVQSAPAEDDDLTLFEIHEGTRVRVDQRAGVWAEIVLDDGKVGWVQADVMGLI